MALQADVELRCGVSRAGFRMLPSRGDFRCAARIAVATFAVDRCGLWRGGVAEQTGIGDLAAEVVMIGPIVARRHGLACQRAYQESGSSSRRPCGVRLTIRDRVIAGADREIDGLFDDVDLRPAASSLMPAHLISPAIV